MQWYLHSAYSTREGETRRWGYEFQDVNSQIAPLTIYIGNLPLSVTEHQIAENFRIEQDCITLKRKPGKKTASAIIQPTSWHKSDVILSSYDAAFFGKQKAFVRQDYDWGDPYRPISKYYEPHRLSSEEFDLRPACSGQPTLHVLHDDILLHIMKYLNVAEQLTLEAVCRRFQSLVYRELGQNSAIDFTHDKCSWRRALVNRPKSWSKTPAQLTQNLKLCTYKMLIMNANRLTTLRLDEYRCIFDINVFAAIGRLAVNLEDLSLQFSHKRKHYTPMKTIFTRCTKLRTLCLEGRFNSDELMRDLRQCKGLEVLRLGRLRHLNWALVRKLQAPLKELSIHNVEDFANFCKAGFQFCNDSSFPDLPFNSSLTTFRMFNNILRPRLEVRKEGILSSLAQKCPALVQLQLDYSFYSKPPDFKTFNNLKVLHFIASDSVEIDVLLKSALPDIEDLYIEFSTEKIDDMLIDHEVITVDFSLAPASVKSLTLPSVDLDDDSYKSLLRLPQLQRVFVKSQNFSLAQLKLLVAHVQLVEIGAAMLTVDLATAQELTALRRKALAEGRFKSPSACHDHDEPLVLHVVYKHHVTFADPLVKIKDHKLDSYIYERVGSCRFDNEWLDFGHDFLQKTGCRWRLYSDDDDDDDDDYDSYDDYDDDIDDDAFSSFDPDDYWYHPDQNWLFDDDDDLIYHHMYVY
ncbi:uncharacterized protein LOC108674969 [Hyalella azteca]|uniref:Uncharacterized protein LOC108674969 n=1 Tax=Hyalella azteca TaxID=294128 RepID=A0A8B7NXC5_HYAAZ|nr:uncharacterized protein LOC108674969 [Hyalella azteca]